MPAETKQTVAKIILEQLNGHKFVVMTGAKTLTDHGNALSFRLPSKPHYTKNGINYVKITLDPSNTYTVEFVRIRGMKITPIEKLTDIYCDSLREVFTRATGLDTSL